MDSNKEFKFVYNYNWYKEFIENQACSIGLFGTCDAVTRPGIWYNVEGHHRSDYQNNSNTVYLLINVSTNMIDEIETVMENNNYWELPHNCAYFARLI